MKGECFIERAVKKVERVIGVIDKRWPVMSRQIK
jgi:hypothetical protein